MVDTPRTEADLLTNFFQDGQANNSISAQDMRDFIVSVPTLTLAAAAELHSNVSQTNAGANQNNEVALEVSIFSENITHNIATNNNEITIDLSGVYEISVGLSIWDGGGGGGIFTAWIEEDVGGGWVQTNASVRRDGSNNAAGFASIMHLGRHTAGDKFRIRWISDSGNVELRAFTGGSGTHPASHPSVHSVDVHVKRIGS